MPRTPSPGRLTRGDILKGAAAVGIGAVSGTAAHGWRIASGLGTATVVALLILGTFAEPAPESVLNSDARFYAEMSRAPFSSRDTVRQAPFSGRVLAPYLVHRRCSR